MPLDEVLAFGPLETAVQIRDWDNPAGMPAAWAIGLQS